MLFQTILAGLGLGVLLVSACVVGIRKGTVGKAVIAAAQKTRSSMSQIWEITRFAAPPLLSLRCLPATRRTET